MKGLDLSKFSKVGSSDTHTTFKHKDGHWIKVAHNGLSPKMRGSLESLPLADGGEVKPKTPAKPKPTDSQDPKLNAQNSFLNAMGASGKQPESTNPTPANYQPQQGSLSYADGTNNGPVPTPSEQDAPATPEPEQAPAVQQQYAASPTNPQISPVTPAPQPNTGDVSQYLKKEQLASEADVALGHIQPETYRSLFAKKDTLGKIGTIFGLLAGGVGGGLTHQQNAAFSMMDQEIQRDLEAQTKSATNAQNFFKLNQNNDLNQAQIAKYGADTNQVNLVKSYTEMTQMTLHNQIKTMDRMPPGPAKEAYRQQILAAIQLSGAKIASMQDMVKATGGLGSTSQPAQAGQETPPIDYNKLNNLGRQSQMGIVGAPTPSDMSELNREATQVEENRATQKIYNQSFDKIDSLFAAGALNPQMVAAEKNVLKARFAQQTAHRYNDAEATAQAEGMWPSVKDWGGSRAEKRKRANEFFAAEEAGTPMLNRFGLKSAPSTPPPAAPKGVGKEERYDPKTGKTAIFTNKKFTGWKK